MILLDTHIWVWWVSHPEFLTDLQVAILSRSQNLIVSPISVWEVALLESKGKIVLHRPLEEWLDLALEDSGIVLTDFTQKILIESTRLPGIFHKDPADRIIVATSRELGVPVLTSDRKILEYTHVQKA